VCSLTRSACLQACEFEPIVQLFPALTRLECYGIDQAAASVLGRGLQQLTSLHTHGVVPTYLLSASFQQLQHLEITSVAWQGMPIGPPMCQWATLRTLHLSCVRGSTGVLSFLNPISSPCLQRVSGVLLAACSDTGSLLVQREAQQLRALQARLGQACTLVLGAHLLYKAPGGPEPCAEYLQICSMVSAHLHTLQHVQHFIPAAVHHIIITQWCAAHDYVDNSQCISALLQRVQPSTVQLVFEKGVQALCSWCLRRVCKHCAAGV
jgi:hypothetical protein